MNEFGGASFKAYNFENLDKAMTDIQQLTNAWHARPLDKKPIMPEYQAIRMYGPSHFRCSVYEFSNDDKSIVFVMNIGDYIYVQPNGHFKIMGKREFESKVIALTGINMYRERIVYANGQVERERY